MRAASAAVAMLAEGHHRAMTPDERCRAASSLFDTARAIVDSSIATDLMPAQRLLAIARRIYGTELPEAAYAAYETFWRASRSVNRP